MRNPVPEFSPERAPVPKISPKKASVPEFGPERAYIPEFGPERAPVPELGPERAPVPKFVPESAPVPESSPRGFVSPSPTQRGLPFPSLTQGGLLLWFAALLSLRLHQSLLDPRLRLGRLSHPFRRGSPDPPRHPGSPALHLYLGAPPLPAPPPSVSPWSRQPFLTHGFFLCQRHPWVAIMAVAWVPPGTTCSNSLLAFPLFSLGSFLHHCHPGICLPTPSQVSVLLTSLLPKSHPSLPMLSLRHKDAPFGRGVICHTHGLSVCVFLPMCSPWPSFSLSLSVSFDSPVSYSLPLVKPCIYSVVCPLIPLSSVIRLDVLCAMDLLVYWRLLFKIIPENGPYIFINIL